MLPFFGSTFLPDLREGHLILHVSAIPGTSLDESLRIGKLITEALRTVPGVRSVAQHAGRAEAGVDTVGPHSSEFEIDLQLGLSGEEQELAEERMRAVLANFPGMTFSTQDLFDRTGRGNGIRLHRGGGREHLWSAISIRWTARPRDVARELRRSSRRNRRPATVPAGDAAGQCDAAPDRPAAVGTRCGGSPGTRPNRLSGRRCGSGL